VATELLNRRWYEKTTGQVITDVQSWIRHPVIRWMAATLDGVVDGTGAVFEAKFMLPWSFSEDAAAEKHMAQVQHNMWVANAREAVLSIITGGGKWVEIKISADPLYQHLLLTAEKKFWRCVESGEPPRLFGVDPPRPRIAATRIVDMSSSISRWLRTSSCNRKKNSGGSGRSQRLVINRGSGIGGSGGSRLTVSLRLSTSGNRKNVMAITDFGREPI
jgi:hypothetical protein